jgi:hypothetical protein
MILPTKGIPPRQALLTLGSDVLRFLTEPKTVSRLWHEFKVESEGATAVPFDWFVLSLDLLFLIDAIEIDRDRIQKRAEHKLVVKT